MLASGSGSNLQAVLDACADGTLAADVVRVVSDRPAARSLDRARTAGVDAVALPLDHPDRRAYDRDLADVVSAAEPDWVVLAGWMRILTSTFLDRFPQQVINLHPALPGAFAGTKAIERAHAAAAAGEITETGVMVHLVPDEEVDAGPVLGQVAVPIEPGESLDDLTARMHAVEHALLVEVLRDLTSALPDSPSPLTSDSLERSPS